MIPFPVRAERRRNTGSRRIAWSLPFDFAQGERGFVALAFCVLAALILCAAPVYAQTFPKFTGLVVDAANVLPPEVETDLTAKLEALQKDTKRQLVVATIPDTGGRPVEDYGYRLGRAWGVGLKDVDNGAILFVAPNEPAGQRGPRIEVGRGLEPVITDALAGQIIRTEMLPRLKANGDVAGAMTAGTDALIAQLRATPDEAKARTDAAIGDFDREHQRRQSSGGGGIPLGAVFALFVVGFVVLSMFRRRGGGGQRYRSGGDGSALPIVLWSIANELSHQNRGGGWGGSSGGGWGGGGGSSGGSDGSWGGGGFTGGGGGDFGGGGASGDW